MTRVLWMALFVWGCTDGKSTTEPDDTDATADTDAVVETDAPTDTEDDDPTDDETDTPDDGVLTVNNCAESAGGSVPDFFATYFGCSDITMSGDDVVISSDGLPPHQSPYYDASDPNWVEFDDRGGTHAANRNVLAAINLEITVPASPTPKGITIDSAMVDNTMNTSDEEYSGGAVGIALNGVSIFAAMAAAGDDLADEQYTFDLYEGHPAGITYHYHFETPGPLEVLVREGFSSSSTPGAGEVELYGVMCDGSLVFGCTELDGSAPDASDFDAQNGHVHDVGDGSTTFFTDRYHTHVCPGTWPDYPYFPEIAFYETDGCPAVRGGGGNGGGPP